MTGGKNIVAATCFLAAIITPVHSQTILSGRRPVSYFVINDSHLKRDKPTSNGNQLCYQTVNMKIRKPVIRERIHESSLSGIFGTKR